MTFRITITSRIPVKLALVVFATLLCWFSDLSAQTKTKSRDLYIGLSIMPVSEVKSPYINGFSLPFKAGIDIRCRLSGEINLSSGLILFTNSSNASFNNSRYCAKNSSHTFVLQLPVRADVRVGENPVALLLSGGIVTDIYKSYTYNGITTDASGKAIESKRIQWHQFPLHPWLQFGIGIDANIKRFKIQALPVYMTTLSDWDLSARVQQAGFMVSVLYKL